jgi:hypothetical protein
LRTVSTALFQQSVKARAQDADEESVSAAVDQRAIAELAEHYNAKGRAVGRASVAVGAVVGVLIGAVPLSPLRFAWPIPSSFGLATVLVGLGCGLLIGFVVGDSRGRMYHRMAQQARAQLVLEERISQSDARIEQLVAALTARARAVTPPPAAAPAPAVSLAPTPPTLLRPPTPEPAASAPPLSPPVSG